MELFHRTQLTPFLGSIFAQDEAEVFRRTHEGILYYGLPTSAQKQNYQYIAIDGLVLFS